MSFKALENTPCCLISHCDHVSIETILSVLSVDTCAAIEGTQLPIVSRGPGWSGFLHDRHPGLCRKRQRASSCHPSGKRAAAGSPAQGRETQESGFPPAHGDGLKGQTAFFFLLLRMTQCLQTLCQGLAFNRPQPGSCSASPATLTDPEAGRPRVAECQAPHQRAWRERRGDLLLCWEAVSKLF